MGKKKLIYFRADASYDIGYGHFIRSLALADMLKNTFECRFFTQSPSEYQKKEIEKVCTLVSLPSDESKFSKFLEYLNGNEIVVLDNYFFTSEYQKEIKDKGCKLVCIDDMHDKYYYADIVINQCVEDSTLFRISDKTSLRLGLEWSLLRSPFLEKPRYTKGNFILLCMGGTDPFNLTIKILYLLKKIVPAIDVVVVCEKNKELYYENSNVTVYSELSSQQMAFLFERSMFCILTASTLCIEALSRGCIIIAGYCIDNQKDFYDYLNNKSYIVPIGELQNITCEKLYSAICIAKKNTPSSIEIENIRQRYVNMFEKLDQE